MSAQGTIGEIEDALITALRTALGTSLRTLDHLPGRWDADAVKRLGLNAPAVLIAYDNGKADERRVGYERMTWHVYIVIGQSGDERHRRRGSAGGAGAYALTDAVGAALDDLALDVGKLEYEQTDNLFDDFLHANALTLYRLQYRLLRRRPDHSAQQVLNDFLALHADYDIPGSPVTVEASDDITLPASDHA